MQRKRKNLRSNLLQSYNTSKQLQSNLQNREKEETVAGFVSCLVNWTSFGIIILYRFIKLMLVALVDFFQWEGNYMRGNLIACVCFVLTCFMTWTMESNINKL